MRVFKDAQTGEVLTDEQVRQRADEHGAGNVVLAADIGVITEYVQDEE